MIASHKIAVWLTVCSIFLAVARQGWTQTLAASTTLPHLVYSVTEVPFPHVPYRLAAHGINRQGDVVGTVSFQDPHFSEQAFVCHAGTVTFLDSSYHSEAWSINDRGWIVGCMSQSDGDMQAALWLPGKAGEAYRRMMLGKGIARAVDACGQVAIDAMPGAIWTPANANGLTGKRQTLPITNNEDTNVNGVEDTQGRAQVGNIVGMNDAGQVVAWYMGGSTDGPPIYTILWHKGRVRKIINNAHETRPNAINNTGQVVGMFTVAYHPDPDGGFVGKYIYHAFQEEPGISRDLGTLSNRQDDYSEALAINTAGNIVGWSGSDAYGQRTGVAFLYTRGKMLDLNASIPPGSGWKLLRAEAINDRGQITGIGEHNGHLALFMLTPG